MNIIESLLIDSIEFTDIQETMYNIIESCLSIEQKQKLVTIKLKKGN